MLVMRMRHRFVAKVVLLFSSESAHGFAMSALQRHATHVNSTSYQCESRGRVGVLEHRLACRIVHFSLSPSHIQSRRGNTKVELPCSHIGSYGVGRARPCFESRLRFEPALVVPRKESTQASAVGHHSLGYTA